jgi:5-methylcytosine-specific restriction endonuclease McrA
VRCSERNLRQVFERTNGHCHFCGDPVVFERYGNRSAGSTVGAWQLDHVIQKAKGGAETIENCLPACARCNHLRWHRTGAQLREVILLGLIAQDEVKRGSKLGRTILNLKAERLRRNEVRRKQGSDPARSPQ